MPGETRAWVLRMDRLGRLAARRWRRFGRQRFFAKLPHIGPYLQAPEGPSLCAKGRYQPLAHCCIENTRIEPGPRCGTLARLIKDNLITVQSGARGRSDEPVMYYNLDAIISIGYRINSIRATKFRIWATQLIKQYMLKDCWRIVSAGKHQANI